MKQQGHRLSCLCSTARPAPVAPAASACTPDEFNTNLLVVSICFPELFAEFKKHYQIRIPDNALLLTFKTWNSEMTSSLSQLVSKSQVHALQAETQSAAQGLASGTVDFRDHLWCLSPGAGTVPKPLGSTDRSKLEARVTDKLIWRRSLSWEFNSSAPSCPTQLFIILDPYLLNWRGSLKYFFRPKINVYLASREVKIFKFD